MINYHSNIPTTRVRNQKKKLFNLQKAPSKTKKNWQTFHNDRQIIVTHIYFKKICFQRQQKMFCDCTLDFTMMCTSKDPHLNVLFLKPFNTSVYHVVYVYQYIHPCFAETIHWYYKRNDLIHFSSSSTIVQHNCSSCCNTVAWLQLALSPVCALDIYVSYNYSCLPTGCKFNYVPRLFILQQIDQFIFHSLSCRQYSFYMMGGALFFSVTGRNRYKNSHL